MYFLPCQLALYLTACLLPLPRTALLHFLSHPITT
jgi:hypothetical protein